ncbi:hypothetical protein CTheo_3612 [Ceratobasidium theobromae]|uniref:Xylanolytic transcriptional activator regulatory domain-containing protein n=1 Tax=Ceratobasidium theobromae TaxID=1582974 RepID=A0A5N5QNZ0_9AGAM|nr:hypothetical protein CTheo_3612 [Ceratobasidium theobromae]
MDNKDGVLDAAPDPPDAGKAIADVQSLHNRVSALEDSWRAWTNTQPGQTPAIPPPSAPHPPPPPPAVVAADDLASALVGLDDVSSLWAAHLGVNLGALSLRPATPDSDDEDHMAGVTPAHIALLPPRSQRALLWDAAQLVLGPHAGLAPRTRARFERMCAALEAPDGTRTRWALSLLAVGTAGLAIGAQVVSESATASPPAPPCPRALAALSHRALSPSALDTDAVLAALLHAAHGTLDGRPRIRPSVWPDVCRAVGVARAMGLGLPARKGDDLDDWRRRVWWEVYCADLFTSDYIGLPPSIDDSTFSTALPRDTDSDGERANEDKDDAMSYFVLKCRLAQLIKSLKRRLLDERPFPFEGATAMERTVADFMQDLPPAWKLDMSAPVPPRDSPPSLPGVASLGDHESALMLQRCELATAANALILKAYYPFLKRTAPDVLSQPPGGLASPHHAALACSSAAHALVHASLTAHRLLPRTRPYSFAQQLFGGAVVAASVAITSPTGLYAQLALNDVRAALAVLRELDIFAGSVLGVEGVSSEAVRVVDVLVSKAESAMGVGAASSAGLKRKRRETDNGAESDLGIGFELPFVGAAVVTCSPEEDRESKDSTAILPVPLPVVPEPRRERNPEPEPKREREHREKPPKVSPYPRIGVRVRNKPSKGSAATPTSTTTVGPVRSRAGSSVGDRASAGTSPVTGLSPPQQQSTPCSQQSAPPGSLQPPSSIPQSGSIPSQSPSIPSQPGTLAPQPGAMPGSLPQPLTVPHQPALQVITEQPAPYLGGATGEYPPYGETYAQMPYMITTPATPVRGDYQREFYAGYDYSMVNEYKEGMPGGDMGNMGEYKDPAIVQDAVGDVAQQQGWYRHAPAGPSQAQQGQWNGAFEMSSWGAPPGNR